jgi:hypothetical protein
LGTAVGYLGTILGEIAKNSMVLLKAVRSQRNSLQKS